MFKTLHEYSSILQSRESNYAHIQQNFRLYLLEDELNAHAQM